MILRRYGNSVQSVVPNFESKALTEISFRRNHGTSHPAEEEFLAADERVRGHDLAVQADGYVQDEAEQSLLADLEGRLGRFEEELSTDEVLLVESEQGTDYPKTPHPAERPSSTRARTGCISPSPCTRPCAWACTIS